MQKKLEFQIVSDVVCPWCYIGKRRIETALSALGIGNFSLHWEPFQLNPDLPERGRERQEYMIEKFGSEERVAEIEQYVQSIGKEDGLSLNVEGITRSPNTLLAHTLLEVSRETPHHNEVAEKLFSAYFEEGRDIGDPAVLKEIGEAARIPSELLEAAFEEGAIKQRTKERADLWRERGVTVVPTFLLNGELLCEGAEEVEWFIETLKARGSQAT